MAYRGCARHVLGLDRCCAGLWCRLKPSRGRAARPRITSNCLLEAHPHLEMLRQENFPSRSRAGCLRAAAPRAAAGILDAAATLLPSCSTRSGSARTAAQVELIDLSDGADRWPSSARLDRTGVTNEPAGDIPAYAPAPRLIPTVAPHVAPLLNSARVSRTEALSAAKL